MTLTLIANKIINGKIYPALAVHQGQPYTQSWREFDKHYPYTIPLRLQEYCEHHSIGLNILALDDPLPADAMYPVGIGFFDFAIDYFDMLPSCILNLLLNNKVRVLFYYHEGDNPNLIKDRLSELCSKHSLRTDCYTFVSANTAAASIPGFVYFNDSELWYWHRNQDIGMLEIHNNPRDRDFTVLNRLHKSWRATAMTDLHRNNLLDNSYWSYCETGTIVDADNPIQIDAFLGLRHDTQQFLNAAPYTCDELTMEQRNNHSLIEPKYFTNAYCNIVMETHFDADGSNGTLLSEKTFKPIKHGQLFFIAGPAGSLDLLRQTGYRVFDNILDNTYDTIMDNTLRWESLRNAIALAKPKLHSLFTLAQEDILHNQQLFAALKTDRLNTLLENINESNKLFY